MNDHFVLRAVGPYIPVMKGLGMRNIAILSRFLASVLVITILVPANVAFPAGESGGTGMMHSAPDTYIPNFRTLLEVEIRDASGIKEARCYFKGMDDADYLFVDMEKTGDKRYEAVLPAADLNSKGIGYFFLSLNGNGQVARSRVFEMSEQVTDESKEIREAEMKGEDLDRLKEKLMDGFDEKYRFGLKKHQVVKKEGIIRAKTDLSDPLKQVKGFRDKIEIAKVSPDARYSIVKSGTSTSTTSAAAAGSAATVAAGAAGVSTLGWVIGGLAVAAGGAAVAGGGGGGGSSSSGGGTIGTGGSAPTTANVSGTWSVTAGPETSTTCPPPAPAVQVTCGVTQSGTSISVFSCSNGAVMSGTVNGNQLSLNGTYPEDGGTTTAACSGTISQDNNSFSAVCNTTWTDGVITCIGTDPLSGTKL